MKKCGMRAFAICLTSSLILTGCATFPEMSEEEYNQTVQYAASVLMKHSNNGVERLSSVSALELQKQIEKEDREKRKAERDAQLEDDIANGVITPDESEEETEIAEDVASAEDVSQTDPLEDESVDTSSEEDSSDVKVDVSSDDGKDDSDIGELLDEYEDTLKTGTDESQDSETTDTTETEDSIAENSSLEETTEETSENESISEESDEELTETTDKTVDGLRQEIVKGVFLTYSGYSIATTYPDDDDVFVINAEQGRKLLILNFRIANTSGADISVDMEKTNPHFQILLNGKNVGYTNVTWLDNDLSTFKGTVKAGDKLSMVLVKQMDSSKVKSIDSLGLIGDIGDETITFNLE